MQVSRTQKCVFIPGCRRSFAISCSVVQFSCSLAKVKKMEIRMINRIGWYDLTAGI